MEWVGKEIGWIDNWYEWAALHYINNSLQIWEEFIQYKELSDQILALEWDEKEDFMVWSEENHNIWNLSVKSAWEFFWVEISDE